MESREGESGHRDMQATKAMRREEVRSRAVVTVEDSDYSSSPDLDDDGYVANVAGHKRGHTDATMSPVPSWNPGYAELTGYILGHVKGTQSRRGGKPKRKNNGRRKPSAGRSADNQDQVYDVAGHKRKRTTVAPETGLSKQFDKDNNDGYVFNVAGYKQTRSTSTTSVAPDIRHSMQDEHEENEVYVHNVAGHKPKQATTATPVFPSHKRKRTTSTTKGAPEYGLSTQFDNDKNDEYVVNVAGHKPKRATTTTASQSDEHKRTTNTTTAATNLGLSMQFDHKENDEYVVNVAGHKPKQATTSTVSPGHERTTSTTKGAPEYGLSMQSDNGKNDEYVVNVAGHKPKQATTTMASPRHERERTTSTTTRAPKIGLSVQFNHEEQDEYVVNVAGHKPKQATTSTVTPSHKRTTSSATAAPPRIGLSTQFGHKENDEYVYNVAGQKAKQPTTTSTTTISPRSVGSTNTDMHDRADVPIGRNRGGNRASGKKTSGRVVKVARRKPKKTTTTTTIVPDSSTSKKTDDKNSDGFVANVARRRHKQPSVTSTNGEASKTGRKHRGRRRKVVYGRIVRGRGKKGRKQADRTGMPRRRNRGGNRGGGKKNSDHVVNVARRKPKKKVITTTPTPESDLSEQTGHKNSEGYVASVAGRKPKQISVASASRGNVQSDRKRGGRRRKVAHRRKHGRRSRKRADQAGVSRRRNRVRYGAARKKSSDLVVNVARRKRKRIRTTTTVAQGNTSSGQSDHENSDDDVTNVAGRKPKRISAASGSHRTTRGVQKRGARTSADGHRRRFRKRSVGRFSSRAEIPGRRRSRPAWNTTLDYEYDFVVNVARHKLRPTSTTTVAPENGLYGESVYDNNNDFVENVARHKPRQTSVSFRNGGVSEIDQDHSDQELLGRTFYEHGTEGNTQNSSVELNPHIRQNYTQSDRAGRPERTNTGHGNAPKNKIDLDYENGFVVNVTGHKRTGTTTTATESSSSKQSDHEGDGDKNEDDNRGSSSDLGGASTTQIKKTELTINGEERSSGQTTQNYKYEYTDKARGHTEIREHIHKTRGSRFRCKHIDAGPSHYIKKNRHLLEGTCQQFQTCMDELYSSEDVLAGKPMQLSNMCRLLHKDPTNGNEGRGGKCSEEEREAIREELDADLSHTLAGPPKDSTRDSWMRLGGCLNDSDESPGEKLVNRVCRLKLQSMNSTSQGYLCQDPSVDQVAQDFFSHEFEHLRCSCETLITAEIKQKGMQASAGSTCLSPTEEELTVADPDPFPLDAKIGSGVGFGFVVLLVVIICLFRRGQKLRRRLSREQSSERAEPNFYNSMEDSGSVDYQEINCMSEDFPGMAIARSLVTSTGLPQSVACSPDPDYANGLIITSLFQNTTAGGIPAGQNRSQGKAISTVGGYISMERSKRVYANIERPVTYVQARGSKSDAGHC